MADDDPLPDVSSPHVGSRLARFLGASDPLPIDPDLAPDDVASPSPTHRASTSHTRRSRPAILAVIGIGGFLGTIARYAVGRAFPTPAGHFPTATFLINTTGAFLLGLFLAGVIERRAASPRLRPFVATGVLGGWTTYSTFSVEIVHLAKDNHDLVAVGYLFASLAAGLTAVAVGIALGRRRSTDPEYLASGGVGTGAGGTS